MHCRGEDGIHHDSIAQALADATADKRHDLGLVAGPEGRALVFIRKKRNAAWMKQILAKGGPEGRDHSFDPIESVEIHGDRIQIQREAMLAEFWSGECRVLVAMDDAGRGLDI